MNICPVCGANYQAPFIINLNEIKENKTPNWIIICPCCGFDLSFIPYNNMIKIWDARNHWRCFGYAQRKWRDESQQPNNWNPKEQIKQIPEEYDREHACKLFGIAME